MPTKRIEGLKKALEIFIYEFGKDIGIFNRAYFVNMLSHIYNNEDVLKKCSVIYGDMNKVNKLNLQYGSKHVDNMIKETFKKIKEIMGEEAIIFRITGDEFGIILPNYEKRVTNENLSKLNSTLEENNDTISVTMALTEYSKDMELMQMLLISEEKVEEKKKNNNNSEQRSEWYKIKEDVNQNVEKYMDTLRIKKDISHYKAQFLEHTLKLAEKLIEEHELKTEPEVCAESSEEYEEIVQLLNATNDNDIDYIDLYAVHEFVVNNKFEKLNKEQFVQVLLSFLDKCSRNSNTGLLSKKYFEKILARKMQGKYYGIVLHTTGLKSANAVYGHTKTDEHLKDIARVIEESLKRKVSFVNNSILSFDKKHNYMIDLGAGDFVVILGGVQEEEKLEEINNYIVEEIEKKYNRILRINSMLCITNELSEDIRKCIGQLKLDTNNLLENDLEVSAKVHEVFLKKSIESYFKNITDTQKNRMKFLKIIENSYICKFYAQNIIEEQVK